MLKTFIKTVYTSIAISILMCVNIFGGLGDLKITEIHYHPADEDTIDGNEFEFVEIKNTGTDVIELTNVAFTSGIVYSFAVGTFMDAGAFMVLAANSIYFTNRYGVAPFAVYTGKLNNAGEKIILKDTLQDIVAFSVEYGDVTPWPVSADGDGYSLVPVNVNSTLDPNLSTYWRASSKVHGSPGADDINSTISPVYINEVLTHTDTPVVDAIELYNPGSKAVDVSGWYLTDNISKPRKFKIPAGTNIEANGYCTFDENDFNTNPGIEPSFSFSSHGEEAYIFSANSTDSLTGYFHGYSFGEIENWTSFGRYVTSTGEHHFTAQKEITLGKENTGPRVGPLVISEIMYNPINGHEYLEITNISNEAVRLYDPLNPVNTWKIKGIAFSFPENISLVIGGVLLVVSDTLSAEEFRTLYNIPAEVQIFNDTGSLANSGEAITLAKPETPYIPDSTTMQIVVPYMDIDRIQYNDDSPWPEDADGKGPALNRIRLKGYGNDPANWSAESGTPGDVPIINNLTIGKPGNGAALSVLYSLKRNSSVTVRFSIPVTDRVELNLFDMRGRHIKTLYDGIKNAGTFSIDCDKKVFASGAHIFQLKTYGSSVLLCKKVMILK